MPIINYYIIIYNANIVKTKDNNILEGHCMIIKKYLFSKKRQSLKK